MKKFLGIAIALGFIVSGCSGQSNGDTIVIGGNLELSGPVSSYGTSEDEAIKMAIEEVNAAGGVLGKQLEYKSLDNKSDSAETTSISSRLITQDNVVAILGPSTSGNAKAAIAIADQEKVPLISPSATADDVTQKQNGSVQEYGFRVAFQDSFQGKTMAKFAKEELKAQKVIIIGDNSSDYAKGLSKEFKASFTGEIVAEESYTETDKDFSAIITNIKNKTFDAIFIPGYYGQVGLIIKQAREAGITVPIIGADGFDSPELVNLAGANNLNDVYYSAHYSSLSEDEKVVEFINKFKTKYNKTPNAFSALAYDSVYLLVDAIERAGSADTEAITKALAETKDFQGVTGDIQIDAKHNAIKTAVVIGLQNGKETSAVEVKP